MLPISANSCSSSHHVVYQSSFGAGGDYDPSLSESTLHQGGEQAIWRAVIVQALMDASSNSKKKENLQWKQDALVWLRGNSKDFLMTCHYAGFEPEFVVKMARQALARDCVWRAAPGTGVKAKKERRSGVQRVSRTNLR